MDFVCGWCKGKFSAKRPDARYCSATCTANASRERRKEIGNVFETGRDCRQCGVRFFPEKPCSNRQYCSPECARAGAYKHVKAHRKRNPGCHRQYRLAYHARHGIRDTKTDRLIRRYPELERKCQSCGETRVLEVAHRPEYKHVGGWIGTSMENRKPHMIWLLCPTCHKLLDKGICTPVQLGLK